MRIARGSGAITALAGCWCAVAATTPASAQTYSFRLDEAMFGRQNQADVPMPPGGGGANSCVPTTLANSYLYLQRAFGLNLVPTSVRATAINVGTNYTWTHSAWGTDGSDWIRGNRAYLDARRFTHAPTGAMYALHNGGEAWVTRDTPTFAFAWSWLVRSGAVTVGVSSGAGGGHAMLLTGVVAGRLGRRPAPQRRQRVRVLQRLQRHAGHRYHPRARRGGHAPRRRRARRATPPRAVSDHRARP